jgi:hypothetical protein
MGRREMTPKAHVVFWQLVREKLAFGECARGRNAVACDTHGEAAGFPGANARGVEHMGASDGANDPGHDR